MGPMARQRPTALSIQHGYVVGNFTSDRPADDALSRMDR